MKTAPAPSAALRNSRLVTVSDAAFHQQQVIKILSLNLPLEQKAERLEQLRVWMKVVRRGEA
jgi:hypothetical protein